MTISRRQPASPDPPEAQSPHDAWQAYSRATAVYGTGLLALRRLLAERRREGLTPRQAAMRVETTPALRGWFGERERWLDAADWRAARCHSAAEQLIADAGLGPDWRLTALHDPVPQPWTGLRDALDRIAVEMLCMRQQPPQPMP